MTNFSLPSDLAYVVDNSVGYQDACKFAFDQFVIFTQQLNQVSLWVSYLVLGLLVLVGLLLYKLWQVEKRISAAGIGKEEKPKTPPLIK